MADVVTYLVIQRDEFGTPWFFILGRNGATGRPMTPAEAAALVEAAEKVGRGLEAAQARSLVAAARKFDAPYELGWSTEASEVLAVAGRHAADDRPVRRGRARAEREWLVWDRDGSEAAGFEPTLPKDVAARVDDLRLEPTPGVGSRT